MPSGFDIAELTYKNTGEALSLKASPFSETAKKERLFLLSDYSLPDYMTLIEGKQSRVSKKLKRTVNRKAKTCNDTFTHNGKSYRVNAAKSGLYIPMLERMIEQFEIAADKWGRVFVLRFDLHIHINTKNNKVITDFNKRLFQKLKREYGFNEIGYCWAREREKEKAQHYHFVLFLDGDLIRHSKRIKKMIKASWERPTGGYHVPTIPRPFYFVDNDEAVQNAIYRISYLAKTRGKGYRPKQTKDYQCSRMKRSSNIKKG